MSEEPRRCGKRVLPQPAGTGRLRAAAAAWELRGAGSFRARWSVPSARGRESLLLGEASVRAGLGGPERLGGTAASCSPAETCSCVSSSGGVLPCPVFLAAGVSAERGIWHGSSNGPVVTGCQLSAAGGE